jgi:uroporphyrin-III C-methyltransferase
METRAITATNNPTDNTVLPSRKNKHCHIAWSAIGLLLITWLCLSLGLTFFWKKNHDVLSEISLQLMQTQKQLAETQSKYQELEKNTIQIRTLIQNKLPLDTNLSQLIEAKQLIQLANYNLIYLHDPSNALSALTLADKQLVSLSNNTPISLNEIRNLLAQNITNLNTLPPLDLNYILIQLHALQRQVKQLPLLSSSLANSKEEIDRKPQVPFTSEKNWLDMLKASAHSFQELIVIRHLDKPVKPLLPELQQQYLQYNLQLLLQQTQWALLHHQQAVYHTSLQQAKKAIQQYFSENAPITQAMIQNLNELEKINLQPTLPDLTPTLKAMQGLIQAISNRTPATQKELSL